MLLCCAVLQGKAAAAERRAGEVEGELLLLGRSLRDAEAAVVEWQVRACVSGAHALHDGSGLYAQAAKSCNTMITRDA